MLVRAGIGHGRLIENRLIGPHLGSESKPETAGIVETQGQRGGGFIRVERTVSQGRTVIQVRQSVGGRTVGIAHHDRCGGNAGDNQLHRFCNALIRNVGQGNGGVGLLDHEVVVRPANVDPHLVADVQIRAKCRLNRSIEG